LSSFDELPEAERLQRYERLARKALISYGLEDAELLFLGQSANVMFRVQTDEGRWALRICNPGRDHKILMRELLWLVALGRDTDLSIPEPVITRSGELLRSVSMPGISGFRACVLFRWVKGQFAEELSAEHLRAMGSLTAKLHFHGSRFSWPNELVPVPMGPDRVGSNIPETLLQTHYAAKDVAVIRDTFPVIASAMRSLGQGTDVLGPVHGDLHQWNVLFEQGSAAAIDFECVQANYFAYDIATTFSYLNHRSDVDALRAAFCAGYEEVRPLPMDWDEHLHVFDMLRSFTMQAWILNTPRLLADDWGQDVLRLAVRKAHTLLESK